MMLAAMAAAAASPASPASAQEVPSTPAHTVENNAIDIGDLGVTLSVPEDAVYLGAKRWALYGVADAELHAWVQADEGRLVEQFWWVQFEEYLPHMPDAHYQYDETEPTSVELGGLKFWTRPMFGEGNPRQLREGSDSEAFRGLVAEAGYRMPMWLAMVRMVHLPTEDRRKELMLIHGANLDGVGMTMAEAYQAEKPGVMWEDLYGPMVERASGAFSVERETK